MQLITSDSHNFIPVIFKNVFLPCDEDIIFELQEDLRSNICDQHTTHYQIVYLN